MIPEGTKAKRREMRVRILLYDREAGLEPFLLDLLDRLRMAGFAADCAMKTLADLGMEAERVERFVKKTPADAWVVVAGSRDVLEWFSGQDVPALAMFGNFTGLPIASSGVAKIPSMIASVRRLVELGHRRIVMMVREERRKPRPAPLEQLFLDELGALGIPTGAYNLPDWEGGAAGFRDCLDGLFLHTPPTAMIFGEARLFVAAQQYLGRKGIYAPERISLICDDPPPAFSWCEPAISHCFWDFRPLVRRIVRWAGNVAAGEDDRRQLLFETEFVEGGTIGPVPERKAG